MKYFKKLEGEKVYLSPINQEDYEIYVKWLNNPRITQYLDCFIEITLTYNIIKFS